MEAAAEENTLVMGIEGILQEGRSRALEGGETLPSLEVMLLSQSPPPLPPGTLTLRLKSDSTLTLQSGSVLKGQHFGRMN